MSHHPVKKQHHHVDSQTNTHRAHPFNHLIRSFWGDDFDLLNDGFFSQKRGEATGISLSEDENHIYVEAPLPGLETEDINVSIEKGILWIQGAKEEKEDSKKYHYQSHRKYSFHIALPENVDENCDPEASYNNGMLIITFSKNKGSRTKKITIKKG